MLSRPTVTALRLCTIMPTRLMSTNTTLDLKDQRIVDLTLRLDADPRFRISMDEYHKEAANKGIKKEEAAQLLEHLHDTGDVFHFKQGDVSYVYLDPSAITSAVTQLLDPSGSMVRNLISKKTAELEAIKAEAEEFETNKQLIDETADRRVRRSLWVGIGGLVTQGVVITRLTFWDLSWDIIEPISYMITFGYGLLGMAFFAMNKADPQYQDVMGVLKNYYTRKLARKTGFDDAEYQRLKGIIERRQRELSLWISPDEQTYNVQKKKD